MKAASDFKYLTTEYKTNKVVVNWHIYRKLLGFVDAGSEIHLSPTDLTSPLPTQVELE
jgi:hypothetical protein